MSIPGLGQVSSAPVAASASRVVLLKPAWEWRFEVPHGAELKLKVLSGTAEKDGLELALRNTYTFSGIKSKIITWQGCELQIEGRCDDDFVAEYEQVHNPASSYLNLHSQLAQARNEAALTGGDVPGPRILICGASGVGKTTLVKTLASYATRQESQPIVVNASPQDGMLSLAGTISAAVFATIMDPEAVDGWGGTPTTGPSPIPVKLPLVYYFGHVSPEADIELYKELVSKAAGGVSGRLSEDASVKSSGVIIDTPAINEKDKAGYDALEVIVEEFSVNIIVVLGSARINSELNKRFSEMQTSLGEPIQILLLDKSEGAVARDEAFAQHTREAVIKEYFFGNGRPTLSPQIQSVDFDKIVIYKAPEYAGYGESLTRETPSTALQHWTLAVMNATIKDPPHVVRAASVMGFVYVSDVDEVRRKVKILAPVSGRLGDRPLILGKWPEPYINLLG